MKDMTIDEMKEQFDSEWVIIVDPVLDEAQKVIRGKVLCHGKDRHEVYGKGVASRDSIQSESKCVAFKYLGKPFPGSTRAL